MSPPTVLASPHTPINDIPLSPLHWRGERGKLGERGEATHLPPLRGYAPQRPRQYSALLQIIVLIAHRIAGITNRSSPHTTFTATVRDPYLWYLRL